MKKIPCNIDNQIFSLKCGFGIGFGRKYLPMWVSVLDLNQNSGFSRTLILTHVKLKVCFLKQNSIQNLEVWKLGSKVPPCCSGLMMCCLKKSLLCSEVPILSQGLSEPGGGVGGPCFHQIFGRSVNPFSTREQIMPSHYYLPPSQIFRPS